MSAPSESLRGRIHNRLWRLRARHRSASLSCFPEGLSPEDVANLDQDISRLIIANDGELIYKWLHYLPIYEQIFSRFRGASVRFLEIGVSQGGSQKIWREYFGEAATIFGIDIDPDCAKHNGKYSQVRIGSQDDPAFLRSVVQEMGGVDVVLDDGSHVARHQRTSFEVLFPLVSDDGIYAIEDLHTAYWPRYEGGLRRPGTAIELLKKQVDEMHRHYLRAGHTGADAMAPIQSIQFFDSIAVVHKRLQAARKRFKVPAL